MWSVGQGLHMPVGMSSFPGPDATILFNFNFFLLATLGNLDFLPLSLGGGGGRGTYPKYSCVISTLFSQKLNSVQSL